MAKLIKKKDCKFKQGHVIKDDETVGMPEVVVWQMNKLEIMMQQFMYLKDQKPYNPGPSLDGFERRSIFDGKLPYVEMPDTPVSDARVEEALAFMAEADAVADAVTVNRYIDRFSDLIKWCDGKKFLEGRFDGPIDTPMLGNPLELSSEAVVKALEILVNEPVVFQE